MRLLATKFVRHNKRAWGGLSKHGIPDEVLDDWFAPATRNAEIRRDLRKFATGTPSRKTLLTWASRLSTFDHPVLVIWATEDTMMPLIHADRLRELFADARQVLIPTRGHSFRKTSPNGSRLPCESSSRPTRHT